MKVKYNSKEKIKKDLNEGKSIVIMTDRTSLSPDGTITNIPRDTKLIFKKLITGEVVRERNGMLSVVSENAALQFIWDWRKGVEVYAR